jgi:hypothetical protein
MFEADQARQAVKTGSVRWVLAAGLLLGVLALGGIFAWYEGTPHARMSAEPGAAQAP